MQKIQIPKPPLEEQKKIASVLDEKCIEIENMLRKTEESIDKKENQKEAKRKYARTHSERNKKAKSTDENAERYADSVASEVDRIESVARDILALGDE